MYCRHIVSAVALLGLTASSAPLSTDGNAAMAAASGAASRAQSAEEICELTRQVLQTHVDAGDVAGAISLISVSGRVSAAYVGLADPATGRKMDENTFFWIASMTKGFCGAAVMACVDRGLLSLDDPVEKYIPAMRDVTVGVKNADGTLTRRPPSKKMTIRMCLAHVAGYDFTTPEMKARGGRMTLAEQAEAAARFPLLWDVETKHKYSNVDINLAGRCVEVATGVPYDEFLKATFFDPLGMREITYHPTEEQLARCSFVSRVAIGKRYEDGSKDYWGSRQQRPVGIPNPAGGLYSTAGDVLKFYQMLANDGRAPDGTRILSRAAIRELSRAQYPKLDRYSLGLRQFGPWFGHDGALQTEAYANAGENKVSLLYVQVTGPWNHPFKLDWRRVAVPGAK